MRKISNTLQFNAGDVILQALQRIETKLDRVEIKVYKLKNDLNKLKN
jgi:hypothetical protein